MRKKKKQPTDINMTAFQIMRLATSEPAKNPAAVALGRLGGLKGGPARKEKLDAERRRQIASDAARTRWAKKRKAKP
jgi:hypothetical protein